MVGEADEATNEDVAIFKSVICFGFLRNTVTPNESSDTHEATHRGVDGVPCCEDRDFEDRGHNREGDTPDHPSGGEAHDILRSSF
jgi:hypothetical protein